MHLGGYVKIHRSILEWEWYADLITKSVFFHCLISANFKPRSWKGVEVKRGQFVTSISHFSSEISISAQQLRTALKKLEKSGEIIVASTNKNTLITVTKFDTYQVVEDSEEQTNNKQITNNQQTNNKQITNNQQQRKNVKKDKKDKKDKKEGEKEKSTPSKKIHLVVSETIQNQDANHFKTKEDNALWHNCQNLPQILTQNQDLVLSPTEQLLERKKGTWTSLDMTLNGGYELPKAWSEQFKDFVLGFWIYLESKKDRRWGVARTINGQAEIINGFLKQYTEVQIIESINECMDCGNLSFNPAWTKNRKDAKNIKNENENQKDKVQILNGDLKHLNKWQNEK